jgi:Flp pilus assembly protein TadD
VATLRVGLVCAVLALACAGCQSSIFGTGVAAGTTGSLEDVYILSDEPAVVGRQQFERGNYGLAERYFRDAVEKTPGDLDSWIGLAASYDNLKRFDLADRAYMQAASLGGASAHLLNNQGYSYLLRGDLDRAGAVFRRALALDPQNPVVRNNLKILAGARSRGLS